MKEHFNKYIYWYAAGSLVTAIFLWFFFIRKDADDKVQNGESADTNTEPLNDASFDWSSANDAFPLKLGSMGDKVKSVQTWLINVAGAKLKNGIDGKFGEETQSALMAFKQRDNISQDYWDKLDLGVYMRGVAKI
jgi:peptidoglycan hydrolase-like protein with peptidoglycan-binding domain